MNVRHRNFHHATPSRMRALRLLLVTIWLLTLACFEAHAQTFNVPGTTGNGWLDTRLDLAPGTLVRLSASGHVDVGAGWGRHGPEGTTRFADVAGYPAETRFRYGLVARLTESRTNPADELRNDYEYGVTREFCATGGGRLWLTVNDNQAVDNIGQFQVVVTRESCAPDSFGRLPRERFRITINGFACHRPTFDDLTQRDGVDDEVFVQADLSLYNLVGPHNPASVKSSVIGDTNGFPTRLRGGSGHSIFGGNGGFHEPDTFPAGGRPWERIAERRSERPPLLVWEGELGSAQNALLIIPSIWEWDGDVSLENRYVASLAALRNDRVIQSALRTAISTRRDMDLPAVNRLRSLFSEVKVSKAFPGDPKNRPVGMIDRGGHYYVFNPRFMVLTYEKASLIAQSNNNGLGRGVISMEFRDDNELKGLYSLYIQVEILARRP